MGRDRLRVVAAQPVSLHRRRFLGLTAGGAGLLGLGLAGCTDGYDRTPAPTPSANPLQGGALNLFSWEEYSNPENLDTFSSRNDVEVTVEIYDSNEELIETLQQGDASADVVAPSNPYVPGMIADGLLTPLDKAALPGIANVDPAFLDQPWDPGNEFTVIKSWGSTGFIYDTAVLSEVLVSWDDFFRAAALPEMSGRVTALEERSVVDAALWRADADFLTDDPATLDGARQALLVELSPHLVALDSYPVEGLLDGTYAMSQAFSGDARTVVLEYPDRFRWVPPTPHMELWADQWCIPAGAPNPDGAHAFIDYMLQPNISARELEHHGYATAVLGIDQFLPIDLPARDMVFFDPEKLGRMLRYEVGAGEERRNEILAELVAAVAG